MSAGDVEGFAIDSGKVRAWKRYPAYKDSGVEWLGEVPAGWELVRLKYTVRMITQRATDQNSNSNYIGLENIESWTGRLIAGEDTLDPEGQSGSFEPGDVLFGKLRPYLAKVHKATVDGMCSTEILVLRPKLVSQDYLFYYLLNSEFVKTVNSSTYGTKMPRANWGFIGNLLIPTISLHDQSTIAAFLDRETARIDALIQKKQRFIELLEEKRQAVISHAVTKGLDPDAEMKDSRVAWIGEVPKHWQLTRLKFLSTLQTGLTLGKKYNEDQPLVIRPYLRVANVQEGYFDLNMVTEIRIPPEDVTRYELQPGDVLMTEGGDYDKLGRGSVWEGQIPGCLHQNHIFAVRPSPSKLKSRFLAAVTASSHGKNYFTSTSQQTTNLATTNSTKLQSLPVPVPPIVEQEEIVAFIQNMNNTMRELVSGVESSIEKLREYRTALISAAVTGKIDVRGEAPAAP